MSRRTALVGAGACALHASAHAGWFDRRLEPTVLKPVRPVVWRDFLGINAQFQWVTAEQAQQQIERLRALGLQWVRLGLHWMLLEPEMGRFQLEPIDRMMAQVGKAGLRSIVYVVGTPRFASSVAKGDPYERFFDKFPPREPGLFAQRMGLLARRYPQVNVWQVWNEPNLIGFWAPQPDPQAYGRMLLPCVQALRATVPGKPIAMAGMAYFSEIDKKGGLMIQEMGKLGAFQLDPIVAYHPYTASAEGSEGDPRDFVKRVLPAHQWLRAAGVKQVWATEWGWSSYDGPKEEQPIVGELGQADHTLRRLALMAAMDYDRVFLFTLADLDERATKRDQHYGLLRRNGEPKPVYLALQRFLNICGARLEPDAPPAVTGDQPDGLVSIGWRRPDGVRLWMLWANKAGDVRIKGVPRATLHHPLKGTQHKLTASDDGLAVPIDTALQILVLA
ncbi:MAG: cellulase family glycosylhydrolase [Aquabacterium sp.]